MTNIDCDDEEMGIGGTREEIRLVARRQFVASLAAAVMIAVGAGVMALMPASHENVVAAPHRLAIVQPTFMSERFVSANNQVELP